MADSIHKGHRQRMRMRYISSEGKGFEKHEILELMLYPCIPQKDINPLAHELIRIFGSLEKVAKASYEDLIKVKHMTSSAALYLKAVDLYYSRRRDFRNPELNKAMTRQSTMDFLSGIVLGSKDDTTCVLYLTAGFRRIAYYIYDEIEPDFAMDVVKHAISMKARYVLLSENRLKRRLAPTEREIEQVHSLAYKLNLVNITLVDVFYFSNTNQCSFYELGYLDKVYDDGQMFYAKNYLDDIIRQWK